MAFQTISPFRAEHQHGCRSEYFLYLITVLAALALCMRRRGAVAGFTHV